MKQRYLVICVVCLLVSACGNSLKNDKDRAQALYNQCNQYENVGDLSGAEEKITEAVKIVSDPVYLRKRISIYLAQDKYSNAYGDLVLLRDSNILEDHDIANLIKVCYVLGNNEESISFCDERIGKNKNDFYALYYRAASNMNLFRLKRAKVDLDYILEKSPDEYYGAYLERGNIYAMLGFRKEAMDDYLKYISHDKNNSIAFLNIGMVFFNMGRADDALKYYTEALKRKKTEAILQNMALYYEDRGDFSRALEYYSLAIEENDNSAASYLGKGELFLKLAKKQEARAAFAKAERITSSLLEKGSKDAMVYLIRGNAFQNLGEDEKAESDYHVADSIFTALANEFPKAPRLYRLRGEVFMQRGDYQQAYNDFNKSFEMDTLYLYTKKLRDRARANLL